MEGMNCIVDDVRTSFCLLLVNFLAVNGTFIVLRGILALKDVLEQKIFTLSLVVFFFSSVAFEFLLLRG